MPLLLPLLFLLNPYQPNSLFKTSVVSMTTLIAHVLLIAFEAGAKSILISKPRDFYCCHSVIITSACSFIENEKEEDRYYTTENSIHL